ncbi:type II toxin-antitoxin system prevent-host-death family antitoxin [Deltaproteobacteria bacterium TL4]
MLELNVKEARGKLSNLLDQVEKGEEIIITRRGKQVARLTSLNEKSPLSSLTSFRETIKVEGQPLSQIVVIQREEERY